MKNITVEFERGNVAYTDSHLLIRKMDWLEEARANVRIMKHVVQNVIDGGRAYKIGDLIAV